MGCLIHLVLNYNIHFISKNKLSIVCILYLCKTFCLLCVKGKFQKQPLYKTINPAKNWRRVSIEWDETQRRIFGGRSIN